MRLSHETHSVPLGGDGSSSSGPTVAPAFTPIKRVGRWDVFEAPADEHPHVCMTEVETAVRRTDLLHFCLDLCHPGERIIRDSLFKVTTDRFDITFGCFGCWNDHHRRLAFKHQEDRIAFLLRWGEY